MKVKNEKSSKQLLKDNEQLRIKLREAENALLAMRRGDSEDRFRHLVKMVPIPLGVVNKNDQVTYLNDRFTQLFGYTLDDIPMLDQWWQSAYPDQQYRRWVIEKWDSAVRQASQNNTDIEPMERNVTCKDGTVRTVMISGILIDDDLLATFIDLTEQKEAEESVHQSEIKYRSLFGNMLDGSAYCKMLFDKHGWPDDFIYLDVNPAFEQFTGLKNVIQKRVTDVIPGIKDSDPGLFQIYGRVAKTGQPEKFDLEFKAMQAWFTISVYCPKPDHFVAVFHDITKRKIAEDAIKASERLYRAIGESIDYGVWICQPDGRNIYASESFLKMVGITQEQCSNFGWGDVLHPDDSAETIAAWQECVRTGKTWNREHRFRGVDEQWHYVLARGVPVRDEHGQITSWAGINLDISDLKKAEEELRQSEKKYKELVENANSIILKEDIQGNITFFNEYAEKFFGYKKEEVLGKNVIGLITPKIDSAGKDLEQMVKSIYEDPDKFSLNINENIKRDGRRVWISWSNRSLFDQDRKRIGHIAIGTDVTDRKRAEDELQRQRYYLQKAQQIGSVGTWEYHADTADIIWTDQNYKNFGVPLGTHVNYDLFLSIVHPDDRQYVNEQWQAAMLEKKPYDIEHRIVADGKIKWVREKAELQFDQNGKFLKALGFTQDITSLKNAERQRSEYFSRLQAKNEEMEHFFRVLRHDLGNPLLSVQAFSIELARISKQITKIIQDIDLRHEVKNKLSQIVDDEIPSSVNYIQSSVKQMNAILEGLKQVADIGRLPVNIKSLDMNKLVQNLSETMKHRLLDADASLILDDLPPCLGDANQIQQVFSNLLTNAVKYKDPNKKCQIRISGSIDQDQSVYCIEDNGIGMTPDQQEKIFEPFFRAGSVTNIEGEGLGLTIVAKILERLDGSIWVESQKGIGSKFFVVLPHS